MHENVIVRHCTKISLCIIARKMEIDITMDKKKFRLWNGVTSVAVLIIAAFTYISTIESTASFWDCGEFTASSYKFEVGHPPGNPVFQLIARFFTMFTDSAHAAVAVNIMSALCSALTIFLLYLTIVFFAKRLAGKPEEGEDYSLSQAILIFGSGAVGALAYCFSDTFWFSAVESEVYAMSSLFTALVVWAMTKWYEQADTPYANRWILLISFLMGLSIGVHLLNLLTIPVLVFLFFYRKREEGHYTFWQYVGILALSIVILGFMFFILIPYLPKWAAYADLLFVNKFGLPYNSGAAFFMIALIVLCFWGAFKTYRQGKALLNNVILSFTTIVIGFSVFAVVIIRSNVMPPTNEYQPDNAFTLVRYLNREQYGTTPLVYGQYYGSPYTIKDGKYWASLNGKYKYVDAPSEPVYDAAGKMLFPRMWNGDSKYIKFYESYTNGKGRVIPGAKYKKPSFGANLRFFFDFQLNWMYWRYFMWNFAGRQNDIHSPSPGELFYGNWETGIKPLDEMRLGDQSDAPDLLKNNKGKNHYYLLPLLLGIMGLFFQYEKDKRGSWLVFLLFFMTGIAIVLYLNQSPYQVRERDYAYAGSFYAFSIWIGFGVMALFNWMGGLLKKKAPVATAAAFTLACLCVPALMAQQNWDDHDRSNRKTSVEMAKNYLNSVGPQGILITHGDNDTFPLWYAQEVEGIRTDVRIVNTSLLGTDWHIGQMKWACNESKPLPLTVGPEQYLYGTNDFIFISDSYDQVMPIADVMTVFKHPKAKLRLEDGSSVDFIASRKISIPVNKENALKYGIVSEKFADLIPDEMVIEIPKGKNYITKPELFLLDFLSNYQWDRPLNVLSNGGDLNIGIKDYLMYEGYSCKLVPFRNRVTSTNPGIVDVDELYDKMMNVYTWDAISKDNYYVDYQNYYTFLGVIPQRELFVSTANALIDEGDMGRALEILDKCQEAMPDNVWPLESIPLGFSTNDYMVVSMVGQYFELGAPEKAVELGRKMGDELLKSMAFYLEFYEYDSEDFERAAQFFYYLVDQLEQGGDKEVSADLKKRVTALLSPSGSAGDKAAAEGQDSASVESEEASQGQSMHIEAK